MSNRLPYLVYFGLASILIVYFLASSTDSTGGESRSSGGGYEGEDGRTASGNVHNGNGHTAPNGDTASLFNSEFWKIGETDRPMENKAGPDGGNEGEPEILDPADKANPVNPQTGSRYSNTVMKQFDKLRKKFPNNSIIPRKKSPEEIEQEKQERLDMYAVKSLIARGTASPEDVNRYYDYQEKGYRDRVELLEYIVERYKTREMSPDVQKQYDRILNMNRKQLENLQRQRNSSLARIKANP